jgi:DNA-binding HxlR family transcriptional regulator
VLTKEVLRGKWKATLPACIDQGGRVPCRAVIPSPTRRVPAGQLTELERHGLRYKTIFPELPPRVEYQRTPLGQSLLPVMEVMEQWGNGAMGQCAPN